MSGAGSRIPVTRGDCVAVYCVDQDPERLDKPCQRHSNNGLETECPARRELPGGEIEQRSSC